MSDRLAHLNIIQGTINRLSNNSFLLKGWSVILISALLALIFKNDPGNIKYLLFFPNVMLWFLDAYYLRQERLFRALFDKVRALSSGKIDFSMETDVVADQVDNWVQIMFSKTLRIFHGTILLVIIVFILSF